MAVLILCLLPLGAAARPISYSGGSTLIAYSDNLKNSVYFHYSPTWRYSIGIESLKDKHFSKDYSYARFTYLLSRKNTQHSQRNLYFQSGVSSEGLSNHFYGVSGDWETRRWFVGAGFRQVMDDENDYSVQYIQLGVAPYIGEYGDLHAWIMLKTRKSTLLDEWHTYPVLKFFKGNFLIELGHGDKTEWDAQLIYRF